MNYDSLLREDETLALGLVLFCTLETALTEDI
jgi:hypothetical protein